MTSVVESLTQARSKYRRIFFRPEFGNAGDALINAGFYTLARDLGLEYTEVTGGRRDVPEASADDLVVMAGGGALSSHWDIGRLSLEALTRSPAALLVLPQSIQGNEEALRRLRPTDTLFVRERFSHEHARSLGLACPVHLDDDVALSLDPELVLSSSRPRVPRSVDDLRRDAAFARHRVRAARGLPLLAWRADAEAKNADHGALRRDDISILCDFGSLNRADNLYSAWWLLTIVSWYQRVETDRLHVGVAAALLGKPVVMHANAYFKIRGVYEQSLKDHPVYGPLVTYAEDRS